MAVTLDEIDRQILYLLQRDAHQPVAGMANSLGVANNTIRNRIEKLQHSGVLRQFTIDVDYGAANIQHHYIFLGTAPVRDREEIADKAVNIPGVVRSMTIMTGIQNVIVEAVAPSREELSQIAFELNGIGLTIEREHLIWTEWKRPYDGFRVDPEE